MASPSAAFMVLQMFSGMNTTVRKRNNLTTSVTLLDELPVSDLFFPDTMSQVFFLLKLDCFAFTFNIYDNTKTL